MHPTTRALLLYFLRLGALGFGGPIALVGYMQRDLVEERKWVSKEDFLEGLAFSQLCPGPLAAQLAKYVGWLHGGVRGATLVGAAFILPSFLIILGLAALSVHFGQLDWIQGMFYGIGAAVSAIIVRSTWKLIRKTLGRDYLSWVLFGALAFTTAWTESEIVWLFVLSGFIALLIKAPPKLRKPVTVMLLAPGFTGGLLGPASAGTVVSVRHRAICQTSSHLSRWKKSQRFGGRSAAARRRSVEVDANAGGLGATGDGRDRMNP